MRDLELLRMQALHDEGKDEGNDAYGAQMQNHVADWRARLAALQTDAQIAERAARDVAYWAGTLDALASDLSNSIARANHPLFGNADVPNLRYERCRRDFETQLRDVEERGKPLANLRSQIARRARKLVPGS